MSTSVFEALRPFLNAILIGLGGILIALIVSWIVSHLLARPMGKVWSRCLAMNRIEIDTKDATDAAK